MNVHRDFVQPELEMAATKRTLALAEEQHDVTTTAAALAHIIWSSFFAGDYATIDKTVIRLLDLVDRHHLLAPGTVGRIGASLGLSTQGRYKESIKHINDAIESARDMRSPSEIMRQHTALAGTHLLTGNFQEAYEAVMQIPEAEEPLFNSRAQAIAGYVYLGYNEHAKAESALERALDYAGMELERTPIYAYALGSKGMAYVGLATLAAPGEVTAHLDAARDTFQRFNEVTRESKASGFRANVRVLLEALPIVENREAIQHFQSDMSALLS
jgi:tetratricopeptide (TPR) repeat protein